ncbi:MAG: branched-chain amino acid transport system substrate-binding protein [Solirubrobacteraceae bacterium]|jgi:branched-chain amino acid transport system substrate-binding protein|nr:branched-chain amino acid transport system substrate-binding protein [Solirubrobacteraceae bacterium]
MIRRTISLVLVLAAAGCGGGKRDTPAPPRVAEAVPTSVCSPMTYGGSGRPNLLVVNVGTLQGAIKEHGVQNAQSVKLILGQRGWRAGKHTVGLQVCDEASAGTGAPDARKCARLAKALARNRSVVGVIGPVSSTCALAMLAPLNRAAGGPIPIISMSNTYLGLTRGGPGVAAGDPARHYPTGRRNYLRVVPADDTQGVATAVYAQRLGVRRPFALHDGSAYGAGLAAAFLTAAGRLGMHAGRSFKWNPRAHTYAPLAARLRRAGADAVFLGGVVDNNGAKLIKDLRDGLGRRLAIFGGDGFNQPATIVEGAGSRAEGVVVAIASVPNRMLPPAGRRFAAQFERRFGARPCCFAVHTGEAARVLLDAIAGSDGSRDAVLDRLFRTRVRDGLLGSFAFDRYGDTSFSTQALYRIERGKLRFVTTLSPSADLLSRR